MSSPQSRVNQINRLLLWKQATGLPTVRCNSRMAAFPASDAQFFSLARLLKSHAFAGTCVLICWSLSSFFCMIASFACFSCLRGDGVCQACPAGPRALFRGLVASRPGVPDFPLECSRKTTNADPRINNLQKTFAVAPVTPKNNIDPQATLLNLPPASVPPLSAAAGSAPRAPLSSFSPAPSAATSGSSALRWIPHGRVRSF